VTAPVLERVIIGCWSAGCAGGDAAGIAGCAAGDAWGAGAADGVGGVAGTMDAGALQQT
jgi:hypothetical protein